MSSGLDILFPWNDEDDLQLKLRDLVAAIQDRLDALTAVAANWETQADLITQQGLARVNETMLPLVAAVEAFRVGAEEDRQEIADDRAYIDQLMASLDTLNPSDYVTTVVFDAAIAARLLTDTFNTQIAIRDASIAARVLTTTLASELATRDTALANRVRIDTPQGLSAPQSRQARKNIGADLTGMIFWWPMATIPTWSLALDGAAVSRTTYADLWSFVQTAGAALAATQGGKTAGQFGPGDGTTTFTLPNLIAGGEFIRAKVPSRTIASSELDAFQGHFHKFLSEDSTLTPGAGGSGLSPVGINVQPIREPTSDGSSGAPRTATETRPRNIAYIPCIVY